MMEYTMARVALIMCGAIMLAAVVPPVTSVFESEEYADMQEQTENIGRMLDTFYDSGADDMVLSLNTVLPKSSSVAMDGYLLTVTESEKEYRSGVDHPMTADRESYDGNDCILITKDGGSLIIRTL